MGNLLKIQHWLLSAGLGLILVKYGWVLTVAVSLILIGIEIDSKNKND